jgi:hypothetical protein
MIWMILDDLDVWMIVMILDDRELTLDDCGLS